MNKPELILEQGIAFEQDYYMIYVNGRSVYGDYNIWNDMIEWATDTFGPTPKDGVWSPGARWYVNNARFWFREECDREWFVLRWS
jgi:hypothetical protein